MLATLKRCPFAAAAVATAALGACSDGTEPFPNLLHGQWGSPEVSLVAISSGAEVQMRCGLIVIEDGIELEGDNSFSARGRPRIYFPVAGQPREVPISGHAVGTIVTLTFLDPFTLTTVTHELEAGVLRPEEPFCPQPASHVE